ncbi:hypothetical protein V1522DRAFT_455064 [Lipomyces starkeyi]
MAAHCAIILTAKNEPLTLQSIPTLKPGSGQVLIKPLVTDPWLVYADLTVRARDDIGGEKGTVFLQGLMAGATAEAQNLAEQARKHGSWAELQIVQGFRVKVIWPGKYQLSLRFSFLPFYYLLEFHFFPTPHPGSFSMVLDEATKSRHVFNGKDYDTDRAIQILQTALGEAKQFEETKAR